MPQLASRRHAAVGNLCPQVRRDPHDAFTFTPAKLAHSFRRNCRRAVALELLPIRASIVAGSGHPSDLGEAHGDAPKAPEPKDNSDVPTLAEQDLPRPAAALAIVEPDALAPAWRTNRAVLCIADRGPPGRNGGDHPRLAPG